MFKHFPKIQLLTLVVALISATSFANPVSQEKAKEVALKFIQNNTSLKSSEATLAYTFESLNDNPYLFIFNVADKGFVVVSAKHYFCIFGCFCAVNVTRDIVE